MKSAPGVAAALLVLGLLAPGDALSAVNVAGYWRLGEDDPGAGDGLLGNDPTLGRDGSGLNSALDLTRNGGPTYTSAVASSASGATGSNLAAFFHGDPDGYLLSTPVTDATDNFGIEAWVNPATTSGVQVIAYNGNTSTSGFGILVVDGRYVVLYGGNTAFDPGVDVATGEWHHVALVSDAGLSRFYVDGAEIFNGFAGGPNSPTDGFAIGQPPQLSEQYFNGGVDEARVFTFEPGQFTPGDLLIPEPASFLMLAAGLVGLVARRRSLKG